MRYSVILATLIALTVPLPALAQQPVEAAEAATPPFNTLEVSNDLETSGFPEVMADSLTRALVAATSGLATHSDIDLVRASLSNVRWTMVTIMTAFGIFIAVIEYRRKP